MIDDRRLGRIGAVLLEAVVALLILTTAGSSLLARSVQELDLLSRQLDLEDQIMDAEKLLGRVATLDRSDLVLRLGARTEGEFQVSVSRPRSSVFRLAVSNRSASNRELLVTLVYRPDREP